MKASLSLFLCWLTCCSLLHGATIFLVTEGTITQTSGGVYPLVDAGDAFRLTVSYSDQVADTDSDPELGVYLPSDLSIVLEILGEGVVFQSIGGSVNVSTRPQDFPVYSIISQGQPNGHSLFLVFSDNDRSDAPVLGDGIPTSFGEFEDYDSVGFSIVDFDAPTVPTPPFPGGAPANPVDGTVTGFSIPEPSSALLVGVALCLATRRRTRNQEVEQAVGCNRRQRPSLNSSFPPPVHPL